MADETPENEEAVAAAEDAEKALEAVEAEAAIELPASDESDAQAKAAIGAQTPAEFVSKQVELTTALSEKLRARAQEFVKLAADSQSGVSDAVNESVNRAAAETKRKAG